MATRKPQPAKRPAAMPKTLRRNQSMSEQEPIINLQGVSKAFDRQVVLDGVDLAIEPGKTTVVIGPSGCGKSVLLKHIVGLLKPDSGKVFFEGNEISAMGERQLVSVRRQIALWYSKIACSVPCEHSGWYGV